MDAATVVSVAVVPFTVVITVPSRYTSYPVTPVSSVLAFHASATPVEVTEVVCRFAGAVGGVVSPPPVPVPATTSTWRRSSRTR